MNWKINGFFFSSENYITFFLLLVLNYNLIKKTEWILKLCWKFALYNIDFKLLFCESKFEYNIMNMYFTLKFRFNIYVILRHNAFKYSSITMQTFIAYIFFKNTLCLKFLLKNKNMWSCFNLKLRYEGRKIITNVIRS